MSNQLKNQSSPYLLQHAENPVDWYPWCEEAFELAKRVDKPIFLSIGYSTCHWCHVMAKESFENEAVAAILNRYFISVKVDREERPDIDSVYMTFCQAFTGRGGWPMSIFMTAEQKPFFAGTYFPPETRYGMIGFRDLLLTIAEKWKSDRSGLLQTADQIVAAVHDTEDKMDFDKRAGGKNQSDQQGLGDCGDWLDLGKQVDGRGMDRSGERELADPDMKSGIFRLSGLAATEFSRTFDAIHGGFGSAPKFPIPHNLIFLILYSQIQKDCTPAEQAYQTLEQMRRGGIFDQIGYGFSRYSTDAQFLVPHFEKMLYDNALLMLAYSVAYKASGRTEFLDTAEQTAEYILREMRGADGEFYSAQDADSEGQEGKFYVWDKEEICDILGEDIGEVFCQYYDITEDGNFEEKNIPNLLNGNAMNGSFAEEIEKLYQYRKNRAKLHLDDKILTSWNALMITAMSVLYRVTGEQKYLDAAVKADRFIQNHIADGDLLYVSCRDGVRSVYGFLDEYAFDTAALLSLYEVTGEKNYLQRARRMAQEAMEQFEDTVSGGYYLYGTKNSKLVTRPKETHDGAIPSGNAVMAYCLVRLSQFMVSENMDAMQDGESNRDVKYKDTEQGRGSAGYIGVKQYQEAAERQLKYLAAETVEYPTGHSMFLIALLFYQNPPQKITVVLSSQDHASDVIKDLPLYADVLILPENNTEYSLINGRTTYYVCRDHMCLPPVNELDKDFR